MNILAEAKLEKLSPQLLTRARNKAIDEHNFYAGVTHLSPRKRAKAELRRRQERLFSWGADKRRGSLFEPGVAGRQVRGYLRGLRRLRRSGRLK